MAFGSFVGMTSRALGWTFLRINRMCRRSKAAVARASTPQKGRGLGRWRPHEQPCGTRLAMRSATHLLTTP